MTRKASADTTVRMFIEQWAKAEFDKTLHKILTELTKGKQ